MEKKYRLVTETGRVLLGKGKYEKFKRMQRIL